MNFAVTKSPDCDHPGSRMCFVVTAIGTGDAWSSDDDIIADISIGTHVAVSDFENEIVCLLDEDPA